jgi:hypothetical protein
MYTGLSAALLRQATYTTARMGTSLCTVFLTMHCYMSHMVVVSSTTRASLTDLHWTGIFRSMSDALSQDGEPLPFYKKAGCGLVSIQTIHCLF